MTGRVFLAPQAGRQSKDAQQQDEPWGTTSSQAHFRAFEPAEMRSSRSAPAQRKTCLEPAQPVRHGSRAGSQHWRTMGKDAYPDPASVVSDLSALNASAEKPRRPPHGGSMPRRLFDGRTTYQEHQREAQDARHRYDFPYRDEYQPRSKRLLYEMALAGCSRESVRSVSTADEASCFTLPSTVASGRSKGSRRSSSAASLPPSRPPTGASDRLEVGIARRRKEAQLRAPLQWDADMAWLKDTLEREGPAGLTCANFPAAHCANRINAAAERNARLENILDGIRDNPPREAPGGVMHSRALIKGDLIP